MSDLENVARLADAVSGMEQAIDGIAAILEGHGELLARLLEAAEEKPPEETETQRLLKLLIGRLEAQQQVLQRIEKEMQSIEALPPCRKTTHDHQIEEDH